MGRFVSTCIDIGSQKMLYLPTYFKGLQAALGPVSTVAPSFWDCPGIQVADCFFRHFAQFPRV